MSNAAHAPLTEAELVERRAFLQRLGIDRKPSAEVVPLRKPLGLAPVLDDEPERAAASEGSGYRSTLWDGKSEAFLKSAHSVRGAYEQFDALAGMILELHNQNVAEVNDLQDRLKTKFAELETENAKARALTAELKSKLHEVDFIVERLRIENKGPPGVAGPRGVDGRDGARGPRGEKGERGPAGPRPVSFETDAEAFAITGLMSDGRRHPTMHLRALFEQYHAQVDAEDAAEEHDAIQAQRAVVEREAANVREGRPAR